MKPPLVTLGVPVYRGADMLPTTLECLRTQTYRNLEVLISIDGADEASAKAAQSFLADPRFRMEVQPVRLGWAGNSNWTLQNRRGDFWIYQQHDDQVSPTYVADLVDAAEQWPEASICYSEMEYSGTIQSMVRASPFLGDPLTRALSFMERLDAAPFRGLMRGTALNRTFGLRTDEFESFGSFYVLMTQMALAGEIRFVEGPTYYKRFHGANMHLSWYDWSAERKRGAWASLAAPLAAIIAAVGQDPSQRLALFDTVLDRFLTTRLDRWTFCPLDNADVPGRTGLLRLILARLRSNEMFDPDLVVGMSWSVLEARAVRRIVQGQDLLG